MSQVRRGISLRTLAMVLALLNVALWFCVPSIRALIDNWTGRWADPQNPTIVTGVQELLVYVDPWLARGVFPFVFTLGFVAIAFVMQPKKTGDDVSSRSTAIAILLFGFEALWLSLIAFAVLFRGPDWNLYWPWGPWQMKVIAWNPINYAQVFWFNLVGEWSLPGPWYVREAPGLILAAAYFLLGSMIARTMSRRTGYVATSCSAFLLLLVALAPLCIRVSMRGPHPHDVLLKIGVALVVAGPVAAIASYVLFRFMKTLSGSDADPPMAYWRCALFVFLVQIAAIIPMKMTLYWLFDVKYFIFSGFDGIQANV